MILHPRLLLVFVPAPLLVTTLLVGYGNGVYPGYQGTAGTVPPNVTRAVPGCGAAACHRLFPGGLSLAVAVAPSARALTPAQAISITTSATGGQTLSTWGGFCMEATAGTFSAGTNSQVPLPAGTVVTHTQALAANNRVWTYGYTAPTTPGLVELYTVVNTANGNGVPDAGDYWGFHGYSSSATQSTPVRLFVNAPGVAPLGDGCVGSWNQHPVLGSKQAPTVGNQNFALELHGAAPTSPVTVLIGANPAWQPIDLGVVGVPGCKLLVGPLVSLNTITSAGDMLRAEGTATVPLPLPNDPALRNGQIQVQAVIADANNGRPLPLTLTTGLAINIQ